MSRDSINFGKLIIMQNNKNKEEAKPEGQSLNNEHILDEVNNAKPVDSIKQPSKSSDHISEI